MRGGDEDKLVGVPIEHVPRNLGEQNQMQSLLRRFPWQIQFWLVVSAVPLTGALLFGIFLVVFRKSLYAELGAIALTFLIWSPVVFSKQWRRVKNWLVSRGHTA